MKRKTILAVGATLALAATAMGRDFAFPSPWNPAGRAREQVPQYITITWDDNAYSGLNRTGYEPTPGARFSAWHFVGGLQPDESAPGTGGAGCSPSTGYVACRPNSLGIVESGAGPKMGMNWSLNAFGSNVKMTYFMLAGFFVNVFTDGTEGAWDATNTYLGWQNGQSVLGFFEGAEDDQPWVSNEVGYRRIPVSWGREFRSQLGNADNVPSERIPQRNTVARVARAAFTANHEIANHSLDHFETNSMIFGGTSTGGGRADRTSKNASLGFTHWTGEGFGGANAKGTGTNMTRVDTTRWGQQFDIVANFGTTGRTLERGWEVFAGRQLSFEGWRGAIHVAHHWLTTGTPDGNGRVGGGGFPSNQVVGWRAPRLESNSNMFYALKSLGYVYDSSLEEGFEMHVNGQNFLWPYTTDNGVRNSWTQADRGSRVFQDTMPAGLWQLPINVVIVPAHLRQAAVNNWNKINDALNNQNNIGSQNRMTLEAWDGKITGFDFNVFIQWGFTKEQFVETMKYTLDLRMNAGGNRAPFNWGTHTDYYTPIYDNATLQNDFNVNNFGLLVTAREPGMQGFGNTWTDRQQGTEEWVTYALGRQAQFVTGIQLINAIRAMVVEGEAKRDLNQTATVANNQFKLWRDASNLGTDMPTGVSTLIAGPTRNGQQPVFRYEFAAGTYSNMTHFELEYRSRTATAVRLIMADGLPTREVILAHRYSPIGWDGKPSNRFETGTSGLRNSGPIPLTSFDFEQYFTGTRNYSSIDPAKIVAIEIAPLAPANQTPGHGSGDDQSFGSGGGGQGHNAWQPTFAPRDDDFELKFQFANVKIYRGTPAVWSNEDSDHDSKNPTGISRANNAGARSLSVAGMTSKALRLNIAQAGVYNVGIYTVNGRLVQSFNARNLSAGINELDLNNLARGVHIVRVQGVNTNQQLTIQVLIR